MKSVLRIVGQSIRREAERQQLFGRRDNTNLFFSAEQNTHRLVASLFGFEQHLSASATRCDVRIYLSINHRDDG